MIKLYNKSGDFCWCNPDQVESMKSVGYTLDTNPIEQEKIDVDKFEIDDKAFIL